MNSEIDTQGVKSRHFCLLLVFFDVHCISNTSSKRSYSFVYRWSKNMRGQLSLDWVESRREAPKVQVGGTKASGIAFLQL